MPRVSFPKPYADRVAKLRVPSGFVLVAAFLWLAAPSWNSLAIGIPLSIVGLALRAWAAGHLEKNMTLTDSGPYAFVRNPLYIGTLIVATGFVIAARRWELGAIFAVVFLLVYLPVMELEEQHLRKLFLDYASYARRVPKLIPQFKPADSISGGSKHFLWSTYKRNREYEALGGFLVGLAVLIYKAIR